MVRNDNYVLLNGNIVWTIWDIDENTKILMKKNNCQFRSCQFKARVKFGQKSAVNLSLLISEIKRNVWSYYIKLHLSGGFLSFISIALNKFEDLIQILRKTMKTLLHFIEQKAKGWKLQPNFFIWKLNLKFD